MLTAPGSRTLCVVKLVWLYGWPCGCRGVGGSVPYPVWRIAVGIEIIGRAFCDHDVVYPPDVACLAVEVEGDVVVGGICRCCCGERDTRPGGRNSSGGAGYLADLRIGAVSPAISDRQGAACHGSLDPRGDSDRLAGRGGYERRRAAVPELS